MKRITLFLIFYYNILIILIHYLLLKKIIYKYKNFLLLNASK